MLQNETTSEELDSLELRVASEINKMSQSDGWQYLRREMESTRSQLQSEINTVGENEIKFSGKDLKIMHLKLIDLILETPQAYISRIVMKRQKTEQMDAYADLEDEPELF